jgi:hypothetical protein
MGELNKFVITRFVPKEQEEETVVSGALAGEQHEHKIKLAPEPSDFEGKTFAVESSGILFDQKELGILIDKLSKEHDPELDSFVIALKKEMEL